MKIISIVGARPNFIKIKPFIRAIEEYNDKTSTQISHILVHTGQHYDIRMSDSFFNDLKIPLPDKNLGVGSGSHSEQIGRTMIELEKVFIDEQPDWVVVVGDVNATLAATVTAKKLGIKVCHIEAGLRSGDMSMPEEINRLVTDRLSDLLLTPDRISIENLKNEGIPENRIKFVGNIMIDTLNESRKIAEELQVKEILSRNLIFKKEIIHDFADSTFVVMTLHRPSNVDKKETFQSILQFIYEDIKDLPLIWPIHPRALKQLNSFGITKSLIMQSNLYITHPLGYLEMLRLNIGAKVMLTDSGGLQEECTVLGTPCLTMRWNTERPLTLKENGGLSVLVGNNAGKMKDEFNKACNLTKRPVIPELWDGNSASRCLEEILRF